ncbi:MAG: hypothetical protein KDN22_07145 [Verrucomicrobiae bacterium]|nr:hypothetical protein [Verrucomicrobiae bacterium]
MPFEIVAAIVVSSLMPIALVLIAAGVTRFGNIVAAAIGLVGAGLTAVLAAWFTGLVATPKLPIPLFPYAFLVTPLIVFSAAYVYKSSDIAARNMAVRCNLIAGIASAFFSVVVFILVVLS